MIIELGDIKPQSHVASNINIVKTSGIKGS